MFLIRFLNKETATVVGLFSRIQVELKEHSKEMKGQLKKTKWQIQEINRDIKESERNIT